MTAVLHNNGLYGKCCTCLEASGFMASQLNQASMQELFTFYM